MNITPALIAVAILAIGFTPITILALLLFTTWGEQ
jgi:uncharacterized membrane protein